MPRPCLKSGRRYSGAEFLAPDLRDIFPRSEYLLPDLRLIFKRSKWHASNSGQTVQKLEKLVLNLGQTYAQWAETRPKPEGYLCTVCRNLPQFQGTSMHGVQKPASDSGHIYAWCAETCLRFRAYLCMGCRNLPRIQGTSMHGVQKHASVSGHIYAWGAETCPRLRAYLCTGCIDVSQIQGWFLHGVQWYEPVFWGYWHPFGNQHRLFWTYSSSTIMLIISWMSVPFTLLSLFISAAST